MAEGQGRFVVGWWWSRDHVWRRSRWLGWRGSRRGWRRGSLLGRSVLGWRLLGRWLGWSLFGWGLVGRRLLRRNFIGGRLEPRSPLVGDGARTRTGQQRDRHHQDVRLPHGREAPAFDEGRTAALPSRSGRIARTSMCDSERSASGACALRRGGEAHSPDRQRHDHEIGKPPRAGLDYWQMPLPGNGHLMSNFPAYFLPWASNWKVPAM
jgi:hypothetical protein